MHVIYIHACNISFIRLMSESRMVYRNSLPTAKFKRLLFIISVALIVNVEAFPQDGSCKDFYVNHSFNNSVIQYNVCLMHLLNIGCFKIVLEK